MLDGILKLESYRYERAEPKANGHEQPNANQNSHKRLESIDEVVEHHYPIREREPIYLDILDEHKTEQEKQNDDAWQPHLSNQEQQKTGLNLSENTLTAIPYTIRLLTY